MEIELSLFNVLNLVNHLIWVILWPKVPCILHTVNHKLRFKNGWNRTVWARLNCHVCMKKRSAGSCRYFVRFCGTQSYYSERHFCIVLLKLPHRNGAMVLAQHFKSTFVFNSVDQSVQAGRKRHLVTSIAERGKYLSRGFHSHNIALIFSIYLA